MATVLFPPQTWTLDWFKVSDLTGPPLWEDPGMVPTAQLLMASPLFCSLSLDSMTHTKFFQLLLFYSRQLELFLLLCIYVTDNLDPCVDRYYSLFIDKNIWSSEFNWSVKEEQALKPRCPDSKVHHSADICCTLTMGHRLWLACRAWCWWHGREASVELCSVAWTLQAWGPLRHLHTCGFQGST